MMREQPDWIQDRIRRLDPMSGEFKRLLLQIAEDSDHPNDAAIVRILRRELRGEYEEQLKYIRRVTPDCLIEWFDEDWEPIGPTLREQMKQAGLIYEREGKVFIVPKKGLEDSDGA